MIFRVLRGKRAVLRGLAALGLAVAGTAVTATPASAAVPGLIFVTAATGFDSSVYKAVRVFCPNGLQVIGGGYQLIGAEGSVVLDDFIPSPDSLLVGAGEVVGVGEPSDGTTASWQVRATAVCASPLPGYQIVNATSDFRTDNGHARTVTARCPAGTLAVGGGLSLSNGFGQVSPTDLQFGAAEVFAEAAPDDDGYTQPWSVSAHAICAPGGLPGLQRVIQFPTVQNSDPRRSETAVCPAGKQAIGGGWGVHQGILAVEILNIGLTFSGAGATASASEDANGYSASWGMLAQVICADI
jgi:hypothetical protein